MPDKSGEQHKRIVCLGDSSTFGAKVQVHETYSAQLESLLRAKELDVDVLNGGVIGYSSMQSKILLKDRLLPYSPDIVVLYLGAINDGRPAKPLPDREKLIQVQNKEKSSRSLTAKTNSAIQSLRIGQALRRALVPEPNWKEKLQAQGFQKLNPETARAGSYTMRVPLEEFKDNVRNCVQLTRSIGAVPILVVPTRREQMEAEIPFQIRYSETMLDLANELSVSCIDIRSQVRATPGGTDLHHVAGSRVHPSPTGHLLIAQELAKLILEELQPN